MGWSVKGPLGRRNDKVAVAESKFINADIGPIELRANERDVVRIPQARRAAFGIKETSPSRCGRVNRAFQRQIHVTDQGVGQLYFGLCGGTEQGQSEDLAVWQIYRQRSLKVYI